MVEESKLIVFMISMKSQNITLLSRKSGKRKILEVIIKIICTIFSE